MQMQIMMVVAFLGAGVFAGCASTPQHVDRQLTPQGQMVCRVDHTQKVRMYKGVTPQIVKTTVMNCECKPGSIGFFGLGAEEHRCCAPCAAIPGGCEVCLQHPNTPGLNTGLPVDS